MRTVQVPPWGPSTTQPTVKVWPAAQLGSMPAARAASTRPGSIAAPDAGDVGQVQRIAQVLDQAAQAPAAALALRGLGPAAQAAGGELGEHGRAALEVEVDLLARARLLAGLDRRLAAAQLHAVGAQLGDRHVVGGVVGGDEALDRQQPDHEPGGDARVAVGQAGDGGRQPRASGRSAADTRRGESATVSGSSAGTVLGWRRRWHPNPGRRRRPRAPGGAARSRRRRAASDSPAMIDWA